LLVPVPDGSDPDVTILVPALDEELTIGLFIDVVRGSIADGRE
jgi:hypothetical protein